MTTLAQETETFCFRLEFTDDEAKPVASETLRLADFHRAISETHFTAFRQGLMPSFNPVPEQARIEPLFRSAGPPARTDGFRVTIARPGGEEYCQEFGAGYLAARASRQQKRIKREHDWPAEKSLYFMLCAYLDIVPPEQPRRGLVDAGPDQVSLQLGTRGHADFGVTATWDEPQPADMPVLVGQSLLAEACNEAAEHPQREIGGLVLGTLHRDPTSGALFLEITCLVSGEGTTPATATSVTFTPDSFARARDMIRLRSRSGTPEMIVGWYHSHPFRFCEQCPLPAPPECLQKVLFYSADDLNVMESAFYQPDHVGLLAAVEPRITPAIGHLPVKLFGWRNGETVARGFEVITD